MNKVVKGLGIGCLGLTGVFVFFGIIAAVISPSSDVKTSSKKEIKDSIVEIKDTINVSKEADSKETEVKEIPSKWMYETNETKMGESQKFAQIKSDDILDFDFPYQGGSESTLTVRRQKGQTDIYYQVSKGQIVSASPIDGGSIRVKFDNEKPMTIGVNGASDYSSDIIFLDSTSKLISKLKSSKKMVIEVEFYNEGNRQIEFDVQGFEW